MSSKLGGIPGATGNRSATGLEIIQASLARPPSAVSAVTSVPTAGSTTTSNPARKIAPALRTLALQTQLSDLQKEHGRWIDPKTANKVLPYALMSTNAYFSKGASSELPESVRRVSEWDTVLKKAGYPPQRIDQLREAGFSASVYRNDKTSEVTIAYRGTDSAKVFFLTDIPARFGYGRTQYDGAADLAKIVRDAQPKGTVVVLTGHSLGGALATYAGENAGLPDVITFNAARNPFSTGSNPRQMNVVVPGELIGDANSSSGAGWLIGSSKLPGQTYAVHSTTDSPGVAGDFLGTHSKEGIIGGLRSEGDVSQNVATTKIPLSTGRPAGGDVRQLAPALPTHSPPTPALAPDPTTRSAGASSLASRTAPAFHPMEQGNYSTVSTAKITSALPNTSVSAGLPEWVGVHSARPQDYGKDSAIGHGYCTDYVRAAFSSSTGSILPFKGNAATWYNQAEQAKGFEVLSAAQISKAPAGAIAVWDNGGYGHVAIVKSNDGKGSIIFAESNWGPIDRTKSDSAKAFLRSEAITTRFNTVDLNTRSYEETQARSGGQYKLLGFIIPK